jgi:hypothetical protein
MFETKLHYSVGFPILLDATLGDFRRGRWIIANQSAALRLADDSLEACQYPTRHCS